MEIESASPEEVDFTSSRGLLRLAAEKGLVQNIEAWFEYRQMRNITSHTYDHEKAQQVYDARFFKRCKYNVAKTGTAR